MSNIFLWNCRGAGNKAFERIFKNYVSTNNPSTVALIETKCKATRTENIFKTSGFNSWHCVEGNGLASSIWFAWKDTIGIVNIIKDHPQHILAKIINGNRESWLTTVCNA